MPVCPDGHQSVAADFCDTCGMRIEGAPATGAAGPGSGGPEAAGGGGPSCPQCGTERNGQFCEVCGFDFTSGAPAAGPSSSSPLGGGLAPGPDPAGGSGPGGQPAPDGGLGLAGQPDPPALSAVAGAPDPLGAAPDPLGGMSFAGAAGDPGGEGGAAGEQSLGDPATGAGAVSTVNLANAGQPGAAEAGEAGAAPSGPAWTAVVSADHDYYEAVIAAGGPDASSIEFPGYCPERRFTLTGPEMRIGRRSVSRGLEPEIDLTGPPTDPGISHLHAVLIGKPDGSWSVLDPGSSNGTQVNGDDIATSVEVPLHSGDRVCLGAWTVLTVQAPDGGAG
ncbi:MAG TPA: FHA domain-containing protein [Streptosporangiaceae bacterium]|jgi:hypothetical protein|nr:FHA domain-containing protein [Streptosporangiaceae bacterium]